MSSDSPELEALFDSIAFTSRESAPASAAPERDTPDLEALFDSISQAVTQEDASNAGRGDLVSEHVFARVGQMTRSLHNMLRELGYDKALEKVAQELPDNRDRLNYIAAMTAQAAERTLNSAEAAQPIQQRLGDEARDLGAKWDRLFARALGVEEFKSLVADTRSYLNDVPVQSEATRGHLLDIIMAQDFQDLTGQVIKKVLVAAQTLEAELIALLLETTPEGKRQAVRPALLEGPVVSAAGRSDVATSQEQVDELLESLGF